MALMNKKRWIVSIIFVALTIILALNHPIASAQSNSPWMADVSYGPHEFNKLDIYRPASKEVIPAVLFIHAGGWWNGDKKFAPIADFEHFNERNIAAISINYRNIAMSTSDKLYPPVLGPLLDAKRALQFVRYNAKSFGIDPSRISLYGESSGGFDALWLGLSPDLANPASQDAVERMPTGVRAIATIDAQTSIDPKQMREWVGPQLRYGGHAFGLAEADFDQFLARRDQFARFFPTLSPAELVTPTSPPMFLLYNHVRDDASTDHMYFVHSPNFGSGLAEIARRKNVPVIFRTGAASNPALHAEEVDFLVDSLKK